MKEKIDVDKVIGTVQDILDEFKTELHPSKYTKQENELIDKRLEEVQRKALMIKLEIQKKRFLDLIDEYNSDVENNLANLDLDELKIVSNNMQSVTQNIEYLQKVITKAA